MENLKAQGADEINIEVIKVKTVIQRDPSLREDPSRLLMIVTL